MRPLHVSDVFLLRGSVVRCATASDAFKGVSGGPRRCAPAGTGSATCDLFAMAIVGGQLTVWSSRGGEAGSSSGREVAAMPMDHGTGILGFRLFSSPVDASTVVFALTGDAAGLTGGG
jgi:hypothetical protein